MALDFSPAQNSILELKIAAIAHLDYQETMELLGETDACDEKRLIIVFGHRFKYLYANIKWKSARLLEISNLESYLHILCPRMDADYLPIYKYAIVNGSVYKCCKYIVQFQ